ncbi:hypothetical protein BDW60DRAFT_59151 [Aspergillus nidulans var. acristatus]
MCQSVIILNTKRTAIISPRWSNGHDFRLSPNRNKRGRPGFDSQSGRIFSPSFFCLLPDEPKNFDYHRYLCVPTLPITLPSSLSSQGKIALPNLFTTPRLQSTSKACIASTEHA